MFYILRATTELSTDVFLPSALLKWNILNIVIYIVPKNFLCIMTKNYHDLRNSVRLCDSLCFQAIVKGSTCARRLGFQLFVGFFCHPNYKKKRRKCCTFSTFPEVFFFTPYIKYCLLITKTLNKQPPLYIPQQFLLEA